MQSEEKKKNEQQVCVCDVACTLLYGDQIIMKFDLFFDVERYWDKFSFINGLQNSFQNKTYEF